MFQSLRFSLGSWKDEWLGGKFFCVFHKAVSQDGWVEADGLFEAEDGETIDDLTQVEDEIGRRTAIAVCDGRLRVSEELVDLLAIMPSLVAEIAADIRERHGNSDPKSLITTG
jgi:hypothetical protein